MSELAEQLLSVISDRGEFDSLQLSEELLLEHQRVVGAVKSLQSQGDVSVNLTLIYYFRKPIARRQSVSSTHLPLTYNINDTSLINIIINTKISIGDSADRPK